MINATNAQHVRTNKLITFLMRMNCAATPTDANHSEDFLFPFRISYIYASQVMVIDRVANRKQRLIDSPTHLQSAMSERADD